MCQYLKNADLVDKNLLIEVFNAVSVYFNYTGSAKCLDWSEDPSSGLGVDGWNIQVVTSQGYEFHKSENVFQL